jgi:hypothetical protein
MYGLGQGGAWDADVLDGAPVVERLSARPSQRARSGGGDVLHTGEILLYALEFLVQHAVLAQEGVYEDPGKGTALRHRMAFAVGEGEVESFGLC